jgi:hypothetical protein
VTDWLSSNSWIFVNYVPGSFGSFLTKCIESSTGVAGTKEKNFFDQDNASHLGISIWIHKFHSGDDLKYWHDLDHTQRLEFLQLNIQPTQHMQRRVHRLTNPRINREIQQYFPNARFVKICVQPDMLSFVTKQMADKTYTEWIKKIATINPSLHQVIDRVPESLSRKKYLDESQKYIETIIDNTEELHTYNFDVANFVNWERFTAAINRLYKWLDIPPADIQDIYTEFHKRHQPFVESVL